MNNIPLITFIDTGAIQSFISVECVSRLNLEVFSMSGSMIIDTPSNGPMATSFVGSSCPSIIYGRDFGVSLVCLPLIKLDVILGMNWLEFNHVHINCFDKWVKFLEFEESIESSFMIVR